MKLQNYLWTLPFLSFLAGYLALHRISSINHLYAPSIVGKQLQDVVAELSEKNLNIRLITQQEDSDLPQGTILSQTPLPGQNIKPHQSIYIVTSKSAKTCAAPILVNKPQSLIEKELKALGIRQIVHVVSSNHPANSCIAQAPAPGNPIVDGKIITYVASEKKKSVLMPDLKGKSVPDIVDFLQCNNAKIELLHACNKPESHTCDAACVISDQRPLAGSIITFDETNPLLIHLKIQ